MPTYTCTVTQGRLTPEQAARLAEAITRIHAEVTGAEAGFAQVLVQALPPGSVFLGGRPAPDDQLFVDGQIRAGRSARDRDRLMARLVAGAAEATGLPRGAIWVYLTELPARCMAEYGHVLPEPGDEAGWIAGLPEEDRARLKGDRGD